MKEQFIKAYTIQEVSKILAIPPGTIRQWEKDLNGLLVIPRTKQGSRFYTEAEMNILMKVKQMRGKNLGKEMIRDLLQKHMAQVTMTAAASVEEVPAVFEIDERVELPVKNEPILKLEALYGVLEEYKQEFIAGVREEIRNTVRKEVLEELKKEVSKSSLHTVRTLSDSIYKSAEKTKDEIAGMTTKVARASEQTSETVRGLSHRVANTSKATSEQLSFLSKQMSQAAESTTDEVRSLAESISAANEITDSVITSFNDTLSRDREFYMESLHMERRLHSEEMDRREELLQEIVSSFRDAASAKEKKWWKPWSL